MDSKNQKHEEEDDDLMDMLEDTQKDFEKKMTFQEKQNDKDDVISQLEDAKKKDEQSNKKEKSDQGTQPSPDANDFMKGFEEFAKNLGKISANDISPEDIANGTKMFEEMFKGHDQNTHKDDKTEADDKEEDSSDASTNPFIAGYQNLSKDAKNMSENAMPDFGNINKMMEDPEFKDFFNQFTQGIIGGEGGMPNFGDMGGLGDMGDPEKMMENLMGQMSGFFEENQDNPEFKQTMESMMDDMLKKESMYPPMKMMKEELPKYLEENADKLDTKELERFNNQLDMVEELCNVYENEENPDSSKITDLLFRLQEYGAPPEPVIKKLQEQQISSFGGMPNLGGFPGFGGFPGMGHSDEKE